MFCYSCRVRHFYFSVIGPITSPLSNGSWHWSGIAWSHHLLKFTFPYINWPLRQGENNWGVLSSQVHFNLRSAMLISWPVLSCDRAGSRSMPLFSSLLYAVKCFVNSWNDRINYWWYLIQYIFGFICVYMYRIYSYISRGIYPRTKYYRQFVLYTGNTRREEIIPKKAYFSIDKWIMTEQWCAIVHGTQSPH